MTDTVEFKYDQTEDNVMMQMAGKLRGLKGLNKCNIVPVLEGDVLVLLVNSVVQEFFAAGQTIDNLRHHKYNREETFEYLTETFTQTDIWAKITREDGTETKVIIRPSTEVVWLEPKDKLYVQLTAEVQLG